MKRLVLFIMSLLMVSFLVCCNGCAGKLKESSLPALDKSELIAQEGGSTVALILYQDEDETTISTGYHPFCTGVWVDSQHILTADHCAKGAQELAQERLDARKQKSQEEPETLDQLFQQLANQAKPEPDKVEEQGLVIHFIGEKEVMEVGQEPSAWHMSRVVAYDEKHDLALLEAVGSAIPEHRVAKVSDKAPEVGEEVYVVGQTIGLYWTYIQGNVASYRGVDMVEDSLGPWMQVSAPVYFGNSGGGAFNAQGELVGIADWIKKAPNVSFFIHVDTIRTFLQDNLKDTSSK